MVYLDSLPLQEAESSSQKLWSLTQKSAGCLALLNLRPFVSLVLATRELLAIQESFQKAQLHSFNPSSLYRGHYNIAL